MAELVCRADDPAWLEHRRAGVTATDITAIIGLSPYSSLYSVYWDKVEGITQQRNDRMDLGTALEPYILARYQDAHDLPHIMGVIRTPGIVEGGLYRHLDRAWQMATPDYRYVDPSMASGTHGEPVEFKSWGTTDGWGDDGSDIIPLVVRAQLLWQMDVLAAPAGRVGCLFLPSGEFRSYRVEHGHPGTEHHDDGTMTSVILPVHDCNVCVDQRAMRVAGEDFMNRVASRDVPLVDGSLATLNVLKARHPLALKTTAVIPDDLRMGWVNARFMRDHGEKAMRDYEAAMREHAGPASVYLDSNDVQFARRECYPVKESVRRAYTVDRLMPVKPKAARLPDSDYDGTSYDSDPVADLIDALPVKPRKDNDESQ